MSIFKELLVLYFILLLTACGSSGSSSVPVNNAPSATDVGVSVLPANSVTGILTADDVDGDSMVYSIVSTPGNGDVTIDNAATGAYTYTHAGLTNGDSFTFLANDGELDSNIATVTVTTIIPEAPASGLQAIAGDQRITLNWDAVPGADSYNVYWSSITGTGTGTGGTVISNVKPPFYHDNLTNGANYYYVVTAVNAVGESGASVEVTATPVDILISSLSFDDANLSACVNAAGATYVNQLLNLTCDNTGIMSLVGIENLSSLTDLVLYRNSISDVSSIAGLTNLIRLNIHNNNISNINALSSLNNLTSLSLDRNNISDVGSLTTLSNLSELRLSQNGISDVSSLSNLSSLTILTLGQNIISDITVLSGLVNLVSLSLDDNNISDVSSLSGLTNLTSVGLGRNSISDVSSLSSLTNLASLTLTANSVIDMSSLSGLINLEYLALDFSNISDVSALSGLTNLKYLILSFNIISDVSPLSGLTSLTSLRLRTNNIGGQGVGNIDTLVNLTSLTDFSLGGNTGMSCNELGILITALGSPPVDTDFNSVTTDVVTDGVNCTNP